MTTSSLNAPCKGCQDRQITPNCHNTCEKYLNWLKKHREAEEARKQYSYMRQLFRW